MAYRVIWSPRALDDVDSIASYIARDSMAHASAVVTKIIRTTRILKRLASDVGWTFELVWVACGLFALSALAPLREPAMTENEVAKQVVNVVYKILQS
jgi:hypothetical protein